MKINWATWHPNHVQVSTRIGHMDPNLGASGEEGLRVDSGACARWPCGLWTGMHQSARAHGWEAKAHGLRIGRSMGAIIFEK